MLKKLFKSKTIDFNIAAGAIVKILDAFGVTIPLDIVLSGFVLMNFILRCITSKSISEK